MKVKVYAGPQDGAEVILEDHLDEDARVSLDGAVYGLRRPTGRAPRLDYIPKEN